jgi:hypothetical protein
VVAPPGYPHAAAFFELAETLHAALTALAGILKMPGLYD